ncbi:MAG: GFA family protein [Gammaproteobacteria bacterium]|nr:GFA family protein [Gammaproteobacteria bacterium]
MNSYQGGCLCGAIRFEITSPIRKIIYCHCSMCRKAQGSAFAANGIVEREAFRILKGGDKLSTYESLPGQTKYFCSICGSPIMSRNTRRPEQVRVRLGTIDSDIVEKPEAHTFYSSRASWENYCDAELPRFDSWEPGRSNAD